MAKTRKKAKKTIMKHKEITKNSLKTKKQTKGIKIRKTAKAVKEPMARLLLPLGKVKDIFRTRYGFFLYDGSEYVITTPETPSPWCNMLTNGNYGMIISQAGDGLSFKSGMADRVTQWRPDDDGGKHGKFVYIRDNQTQKYWSTTWKPVCENPEFYEVRHGIGYTNITSKNHGIITSTIYFVAADEHMEIWQLRIVNDTDEAKFLSVFSSLEWDFNSPSANREYNKLFIDTEYDEKFTAIFARTPNNEYAFHSVNHPVTTFSCAKAQFIGTYRDPSNPRCVEKGMCFGESGRYYDPAAALHIEIELPPRGEKELIFTVGVAADKQKAKNLTRVFKNVKTVEEEFSRACQRWTMRFNGLWITTPDEGTNILNNRWFRYQAISSGLASLGSYQKPSGMVKFKDRIINGLTYVTINPKYFKPILINCAEKEFQDGSVIEEWNPITQKGEKSSSLEAPLWLVYSVCEYLKETKDASLLKESIKFQDAPKETLLVHCRKIIDRVIDSIGKKGLPPMLDGDYLKKLDGVSKDAKGESVWLCEFLIYIIKEFIAICEFADESKLAEDYETRLKKIVEKFKKIAWDKDRFTRAVSHSGKVVGISKGKNARLFLDTQLWSIISGICDKDTVSELMEMVREDCYKSHGPVSVWPAYCEMDEDVGTLSKLPSGIMENAGVNVESACWAIWAETILGKAKEAWHIYSRLDPVDRSHKSDLYKLEPFVAPEYIDDEEAPTNGKARNSWYNRAAYWMFKVMVEHILGVKPTFNGLEISPCIPSRWRLFRIRRTFRNAYYNIEVFNPNYISQGAVELTVDGKKMGSNIIPDFGDEKRHNVKVVIGKVK